jgi:hypothetical protein
MKQLDTLLKQIEGIQKEMATFGKISLGDSIPTRYIDLGQHLRVVEEHIVTTREWYSLNVLESLQNETRILKYLTVVLIILTGVLAVPTALLASGVRI